jgi:hypothetical protein
MGGLYDLVLGVLVSLTDSHRQYIYLLLQVCTFMILVFVLLD